MANRLLVYFLVIFLTSVLPAQEIQRIDFKLEAPGKYIQQLGFVFGPELSDEYESEYDAFAFSPSSTFSMSVPLNGNNWLVVAVQTIETNRVFPINLVTNTTRTYTLTVESFSNFDGRDRMYFVDSLQGKTYRLNPDSQVSIEIKPTETTDRFFFYIEKIAPATWNGSSWSNTSGPSESDNVNFTGDYTLSSDGDRISLVGNDFMIQAGVTVIIDNEATLDIKGDLTNSGQLTIASGASLLTYGDKSFGGNDILIKRNTRYAGGKYSFVGSPVRQSQSITGSDLGAIVYQYNETIPFGGDVGLMRWEDAVSKQLVTGRGYAQANQQEITFTGVPNSGDISFNGTYTQDQVDVNEGWNLVANPYPAAIDAAGFLNHNPNITGALYLWDDNGSDTGRGSNSDYIVVNASGATNTTPAGGQGRYNGYLASSQGFFVKLLDNSNTTVSFTEDMRVAGNNQDDHFFRSNAVINRLRLNLTNEKGLFRQTLIAFKDDVDVTKFNRLYDAHIFSQPHGNAIYSIKSGVDLAIQSTNPTIKELAFGLNVAESGQYHLTIDNSEFDRAVYLDDRETGETILLTDQGYSFQTDSGVIKNRFSLRFKNSVLSTISESRNIYANANKLFIEMPELAASEEFQVVSLSGQIVKRFNVTQSSTIGLADLRPGVYLLLSADTHYKFVVE